MHSIAHVAFHEAYFLTVKQDHSCSPLNLFNSLLLVEGPSPADRIMVRAQPVLINRKAEVYYAESSVLKV